MIRLQREVPVTARRYDEKSSTGRGQNSDILINKRWKRDNSSFLSVVIWVKRTFFLRSLSMPEEEK